MDSKYLLNLLRTSEQEQSITKANETWKKRGILRGGTVGCIDEDGTVYGSDPRSALVRYLGYSTSPDFNRGLMFDGGFSNEDIWLDHVTRTYPHVIKCEEEIPVSYTITTAEGTEVPVTGRPDMVLCDAEGEPEHGIELKLVCSVFTAKTVGFATNTPKSGHLIQAIHYMHKLGLSKYTLAYTSRVDWATPFGWANKYFPPEHPSTVTDAKNRVYKINPFYSFFDLKIDEDGYALYKHIDADEWTPTKVSVQGIQRWYELVANMAEKKMLTLKRPSHNEPYGKRSNYSLVDKGIDPFYDENRAYDSGHIDFDEWVAECITKCDPITEKE